MFTSGIFPPSYTDKFSLILIIFIWGKAAVIHRKMLYRCCYGTCNNDDGSPERLTEEVKFIFSLQAFFNLDKCLHCSRQPMWKLCQQDQPMTSELRVSQWGIETNNFSQGTCFQLSRHHFLIWHIFPRYLWLVVNQWGRPVLVDKAYRYTYLSLRSLTWEHLTRFQGRTSRRVDLTPRRANNYFKFFIIFS